MACVDLPAFPLQLLLRRHPEWKRLPAAVVDRDRPQGILLWVNERAREKRILPGMRYAAGLSLDRELRAGVVSHEEIEAERAAVARRLATHTPEVEPSRNEPGVFWLGASGLSLLHGPLERWGDLIRQDLSEASLESRVAVGFSRFGVYAAARASRGCVVFADPAEERLTVRDIPLARLWIDSELRDNLALLGIHSLGLFLDLPGREVRRRFPPDVWALHQMARGEMWSPLEPRPLDESRERRAVLDQPEIELERLLHVIAELIGSHLAALRARGLCLAALRIELALDVSRVSGSTPPSNGRNARRPESIESRSASTAWRTEHLRPASPTLDAGQIMELVRLRLEGAPLAAGVVEIVLDSETAPATPEQLRFFVDRPRRDLAAASRALAALRAEFGERAVVRARLREAHLPEARFEWEPLDRLEPPAPRQIFLPPLVRRLLSRPDPLPWRRAEDSEGWILIGPEKTPLGFREDFVAREGSSIGHKGSRIDLEGVAGAGRKPGPIAERVGPYVVSGGWWRRSVHREYYFVRSEEGRWSWVYYDRERERWFLHGEVG